MRSRSHAVVAPLTKLKHHHKLTDAHLPPSIRSQFHHERNFVASARNWSRIGGRRRLRGTVAFSERVTSRPAKFKTPVIFIPNLGTVDYYGIGG
jgi:hypothetical protein